MIRAMGAAMALAGLSACTTVAHMPLTPDSSARLQGKTVTSTQYPTPDFVSFTAGKAAFALIGAAAMISEGNQIVKDNAIDDPAQGIARGLTDRLVAARAMKTVAGDRSAARSDEVGALVTMYPGADYIVDVKTLNWMFNYYPSDWAHYRVTYGARVRLIDAASKKVVAETMCNTVQGDDKKPPDKDQLLENRAALLKTYLQQGAAACIDVLSRDMLKL